MFLELCLQVFLQISLQLFFGSSTAFTAAITFSQCMSNPMQLSVFTFIILVWSCIKSQNTEATAASKSKW